MKALVGAPPLLVLTVALAGCLSMNPSTSLFELAKTGTAQSVQAAIDQGEDVNEKDTDNWTPLMAAAWYSEDPNVIVTLLKADARVNDEDNYGYTALMYAAQRYCQMLWAGISERPLGHPFSGGIRIPTPSRSFVVGPPPRSFFLLSRVDDKFFPETHVMSGGFLKFTVDEPPPLHHQLDLFVPRQPPPGFLRFESQLEHHRQRRHS